MSDGRSPVTEVAVFGIGMGLLCSLGGYEALTGITNAPDLWGLSRNVAIGAPLAAIGLCLLASGAALLATRHKAAVAGCVAATVSLSGFVVALELSTAGRLFAFKLISLLAYAMPFVMISRGLAAAKLLDREASGARAP